jgi:hypothetical protein
MKANLNCMAAASILIGLAGGIAAMVGQAPSPLVPPVRAGSARPGTTSDMCGVAASFEAGQPKMAEALRAAIGCSQHTAGR